MTRYPSLEQAELDDSLDLPVLNNDLAVALGIVAVQTIQESELDLAVEVRLGDEIIFRANLGTTGSGNDPWLARKARAVVLFNSSSMLARLRSEAGLLGSVDESELGIALHGGAFPLRVAGSLAGTIAMSGEPDQVDHEIVVRAVRRYLATAV